MNKLPLTTESVFRTKVHAAFASSSSSNSSNQVYDPKDANKDGEVSWKEEQDYSLQHSEEAETQSGVTSYADQSLDVLA